MFDEREATRRWRQIFQGQAVTRQTLSDAETLLDGMNPESPLRFRLAAELADLRTLQPGQSPKRRR